MGRRGYAPESRGSRWSYRSSCRLEVGELMTQGVVDLAGDVAFQAPDDLAFWM